MTRKMKESGIEWIGKIPEEWKVEKNKRIFTKKKEIVGDSFEKYNLLSLTKKGVKEKDINNPEGKLPATFATYQKIEKNDMILCLFDLDVSAVFSGLTPFNGMISPAYSVYNVISESCPKYYDYFFAMIGNDRHYIMYAKSLRKTINADIFGEISSLLPPVEEQKKIANFLDKQTSLIDNIIEDTKQSTEELKQYKQSLITEIVTKGLDKNVEMKDSGVEWMGKIPIHWMVTNLGKISKLGSGGTPTSSDRSNYDNGNIPWVRSLDLKEKGIKQTEININKKGLSTISGGIVPRETIVLAMYGGSGTIGNSGYLEIDAATNQAICTLQFQECYSPKYMFYFIRFLRPYWMIYAVGTRKDPNISKEIVSNMPCLDIPINEQVQISNYLEEKMEKIDELIEEKQQLISEFESYKKSMIYEYVTGKKEVL